MNSNMSIAMQFLKTETDKIDNADMVKLLESMEG